MTLGQIESKAQSAPALMAQPGAWPTRLERADMDEATTRVCKACGVEKPITEFYLRSDRPMRIWRCKPCYTEQTLARRDREPEKEKARRRKRAIAEREIRNERQRQRRQAPETQARERLQAQERIANAPYKHHARVAVQAAVKRGELVKPDACERCGRETRLYGHHADYSKLLEVEWLCGSCHGLEHERLAALSPREDT